MSNCDPFEGAVPALLLRRVRLHIEDSSGRKRTLTVEVGQLLDDTEAYLVQRAVDIYREMADYGSRIIFVEILPPLTSQL